MHETHGPKMSYYGAHDDANGGATDAPPSGEEPVGIWPHPNGYLS